MLIAHASRDSRLRDMSKQTEKVLRAWEMWQRRCAHCRRAEPQQGEAEPAAAAEGKVQLSFCAKCRSRAYCGSKCQAAAWPAHKAECKVLAAL